jgi:hypothetical protein
MTPNTSPAAIGRAMPTAPTPQGSKTTAVAIVETMPEGTPPQPFNLPSLVRTAADDLGTPDPHVIATEVLARIDTDDLADALALCLPDYVRKTVRVALPDPEPTTAPVFEGSNGTRFASPKARATWEARWTREKATPVDAGGGTAAQDWKYLGNCNHGDLLRLEAHRRREADANSAAADRFAWLAKLLEHTGAATVSALSADDVAGAA